MKKNKNEIFRGLRGSLGARVLLITMVLLVVPLLFLSGFLYYDQVWLKEKENRFTLGILIDRSEKLIRHTVNQEREFLDGVDLLFDPTKGDVSALADLAKRGHFETLFHVSWQSDGYVCDYGSDPKIIGTDFTSIVKSAIEGTSLIVLPESSKFYIVQISRGERAEERTEERTGWVATFSIEEWIDKLHLVEHTLYPTATSLLTVEGKVLFSTASLFRGRTIKQRRTGATFTFALDNEEYLGRERHIPEGNFSLLISMPAQGLFVDVPYLLMKILIFLGVILITGGGGVVFLTFRLSTPLKQLCTVMQRVGQGNLSSRFRKDKMGFEVNILGAMFNDMVASLIEHIKEVERERGEKEVFARELLIGQEVQRSILPKQLPPFSGLDIAARFVSAKEVGGDFYDFLVKKSAGGDQLMISIADASGKGISSCLYSLSVRSMLRSYGKMHSALKEIVLGTNNLFYHDTGDSGIFVTAWVALFDEKTKELCYSNCGHYPPFLKKRGGELKKLTTEGIALGVVSLDHISTGRVVLESGDLLLLFTDGVVEAHNEKMEMFGEEKVIELLDLKKNLEAREIVDEMIEEVALFAAGFPQHDDLTFVVLKVR